MTFVGETAPARLGRVRWRRFAIILVPATALVVMLLMLTSQSVLAVSVSISGQPFDVTAKLLKGQGFEQFGVVEHSATNDLPGHSNQIVLAATAMRSATISHLCQSVNVLGVPMYPRCRDQPCRIRRPVLWERVVQAPDAGQGRQHTQRGARHTGPVRWFLYARQDRDHKQSEAACFRHYCGDVYAPRIPAAVRWRLLAVMACIYGSGNGRSKQNPARSTGGSLAAARHTFRIWRRTRPFWGGLIVIVGAGEMLVSEQAPLRIVTHIGIQGLAGYLIPAFMLLCGALLWLNPIDRIIYSLLALFLALGSWITSNLGGFFVGMVAGVVGGALAFAWTTEAEHGPPACAAPR